MKESEITLRLICLIEILLSESLQCDKSDSLQCDKALCNLLISHDFNYILTHVLNSQSQVSIHITSHRIEVLIADSDILCNIVV